MERPKVWRRPRLSTQILLLQVAIIVLTVGAGLAVSVIQARRQLDKQTGETSLAIARSVASLDSIVEAFGEPRPERTINPIAEGIRKRTEAAFIVVANRQGIRYSHPDSAKIGERVSTDPSVALSGREYIGSQTGPLGPGEGSGSRPRRTGDRARLGRHPRTHDQRAAPRRPAGDPHPADARPRT